MTTTDPRDRTLQLVRNVSLVFALAASAWPAPLWAGGNITVSVDGGTLRVRGDGAANLIPVVRDSGLIFVGNDGTTNGGTDAFIAEGYVDISLNAAGGDDTLNVVDMDAASVPETSGSSWALETTPSTSTTAA